MECKQFTPGCIQWVTAIAVSMLLVLIPHWSFAQNSKVGFVSIPKIMENSAPAKAARKRLQNEFSDTRDELNACSEGLERLDKKLRSEGKEMDEDRRERMIETITRKRRECDEVRTDLESKLNKRRSEELDDLQELIAKAVRKIAEDRKVDLIVGPPTVLYRSDQIDLTEAVLKELDNR